MNNNGLKAVLGLIVVLAVALIGYVLYERTPAKVVPTGDPGSSSTTVPNATTTSSLSEMEVIGALLEGWPSLYKDLKVVPANSAWYIYSAQFIGNNRLLVYFEDGHVAYLAVLGYANNNFTVVKVMPETMLSMSEWQNIVSAYGDPRGPISNYTIGIMRNGEYIQFDALTKVPENVIAWSKVKIALLAGGAKDGDGERLQGCDLVVFRDISVPATTMPLTAAMRELFVKRDPWPYTESANGNFITSQNLTFDRAVMEGSTAKIYIKGSYVLSGVCDDPRIEVQIRNTALQFPTVKNVEIYLNGSRFVIPSQR